MSDMERDFGFAYINADGKTKRTKIDLAVFEAGKPHDAEWLIRTPLYYCRAKNLCGTQANETKIQKLIIRQL